MSNQKKIILIYAICIFVVAYANIKPKLRNATALRFVNSVLQLWEDGDQMAAIEHFAEPEKSPPIYNLDAYTIITKEFERKDGIFSARFTVNLDFGTDKILPSDKDWLIVVQKKPEWKITQFQLIDE